jgi:hypothetical protein
MYRMLPPTPTPSPLEPVESFSENEAHERPISKEISVEGTFVSPLIPQVGQLNIIGKYNHGNLYPYIELLMTLRTLAQELRDADKKPTSPPPQPRSAQYSA